MSNWWREMAGGQIVLGFRNCAQCGREHIRWASGKPASRCWDCHATEVRGYRRNDRKGVISADEALKRKARTAARLEIKRGKLKWMPCWHCGSPKSQMHHPDYSKPLSIYWLCRACHNHEHKKAA